MKLPAANAPGLQQLEVACEGEVISHPVTFEYKANKEVYKANKEETGSSRETKKGERTLETGLLERLEALGLCKAEEMEKLDKARRCSQVRRGTVRLGNNRNLNPGEMGGACCGALPKTD